MKADILNLDRAYQSNNGLVGINALKKSLLMRPEVLSIAIIAGNGLLSLNVTATDLAHLHRFVHSLQKNGDSTTKIVFAEEKSQLTLVERMRILKDQTEADLEGV